MANINQAINPISVATFNLVAPNLPPMMAVLMRGPTGIGKSHLVKAIAKAKGLPLVDVRGSTMSEGDVAGYPDIEGMKESGVMTFCMPSWFIKACNEPVILFLDEMNRSLPGVMQSFFQIALDRELGNDINGVPYKLHPETRVFAAVNFGSEYDVNDMDPALLRRFWTCDLKAEVETWVPWAVENKVDQLIVDFINNNHSHFRVDPSEVQPGTICPNPASWHRLDECLKYMKLTPSDFAGQENPPGMYATAMGLVGQSAAQAFCKFVQDADKNLTVEDIFKGKLTEELIHKTPKSVIQGLIDNVGFHSKENNWTPKQTKAIGDFAKLLPGEQMIDVWNKIQASSNYSNVSKLNNEIGQLVVAKIQASRKL